MFNNFALSTTIFESLGVLSGFTFARTVWSQYEDFAINKLNDSTIKIRGSVYYIKDLPAQQAYSEWNAIQTFFAHY